MIPRRNRLESGMRLTRFVSYLGIALLVAMSPLRGQISCDLFGLKLGERVYTFDSEMEVVADCLGSDSFRAASLGGGSVVMHVREIGGVRIDAGNPVEMLVFGGDVKSLKAGARYRIKGEIRDGFGFGGGVSLSYFLTACESLGASPKIPAAEKSPLVDLVKLTGKEVEILGVLWSRNGVWSFAYGEENVYLTDASGRSDTYQVDWHGRRVRVKGLVKRQLRASLDQISTKTARDLVMYSLIVNAQVALDSEAGMSDEGNRFRALYERTPKLVDGAFELLAEPGFRRNIVGGETTARLFVERNWAQIEHMLLNATDASKDTIAGRMNDSKIDGSLRSIYASILAALGDSRGRDYFKRLVQPGKDKKPEPDVIFLLGAIDSLKSVHKRRIEDGEWIEELALTCLRLTPGQTVLYSSIAEMLCERKSKPGIDLMIDLMLNGASKVEEAEAAPAQQSTSTKGGGRVDTGEFDRLFGQMGLDPDAMSPADYSSALLLPVLSAGPEFVTTGTLIRLAEKFPEPDYNRRLLFREMLKRDDPRAISLFYDDLKTSFWPMELEEYAGPKIISAVREELPKLNPGEVRTELEFLLTRRTDNAAANFAKMLEDPQTPIEDLLGLSWELAGVEGGDRHAASVARAIQKRVLKQAQAKPDAMDVTRMIKGIGESSEASAVEAMIDLLAADFSVLADEWVSVTEFRHHIAGQLAEMTGESFGIDHGAWEKWLAQKSE